MKKPVRVILLDNADLPKKMILTHVEGSIHQTYDMIKKEAEKYPNVDVAYDGMFIKL